MASERPYRRPRFPMPEDMEAALRERELRAAYEARPAYQRNDYIWWVTSAKRDATRSKRLAQVLDELAGGEQYMNMAWRGAGQREKDE